MAKKTSDPAAPSLNRDDVVRVCGDILDWKVKAIIDTGGTLSELEAAHAWASGADEVLGEEREPLAGVPAAIYDILLADEELDEER